MLGPVGRGELAALILWPSALGSLASFGIGQAIVFHAGRQEHGSSEVCTAGMVIGFVQTLVILLAGVLLIPIALKHYSPEVRYLSLLFLITMPTFWLSVYPASFFQGRNELFQFNALRLISQIVYALGLAFMLVAHRTALREVVFIQMAGYPIAFAIGVIVLVKVVRLRFAWSRAACGSLLKYGAKAHVSNMTAYFNQRVDQLILSVLVSPAQLGLYAVAVTLSTGVGFVPLALGSATFAAGANQGPDHAKRTIARAFGVSLLWLTLACAALFVASPFAINLLFGSKFSGSVLACRLLLPGMIALGLNQVLYSGASAMGHPALPSYAEGVGLAVTAGGLYLFVPRFGFLAAATVSSAAYVTSFVLMLILSRIRLGIHVSDFVCCWGKPPQMAEPTEQVSLCTSQTR